MRQPVNILDSCLVLVNILEQWLSRFTVCGYFGTVDGLFWLWIFGHDERRSLGYVNTSKQ